MNLAFLKTMNVLIVEDDTVAASFLFETLKDFFYKVYIASNGHQALELLKTHNINLLITDLSMPFYSGKKLIQTIREHEEIHSKTTLPILVISAYKEPDDLLEMIKHQLIDYIVKPFSLSQLMSALNKLGQRMKTCNQYYHIDSHIIYDSFKKILLINEQNIPLTQLETVLLEILLENKGRIVPRSTIIEKVYQKDVTDVTFRNLVMRLRKKIGKTYLINVKDIGIRLA